MIRFRKFNALFIAISLLFVNCGSGAKVIGKKLERPLNIILMIGDGMGLAQISAAAVINGGLSLDIFQIIGLIRTSSQNDYITDSAAGATAFSTGTKSYNGAIGVGADTLPRKTILEHAEDAGLSTGLIATCSITHATPAAFYAHKKHREMHQEIANDFYGKGIDFIAGGGKTYFNPGRLQNDAYTVYTGAGNFSFEYNKKYCWFYSDSIDLPKAPLRGDWLARATSNALQYLSQNKKGFFLMVEGSQIDWGGHDNDLSYSSSELIDFDKAVAAALDFAKKDGNTLVIVTADHETGGLSLLGGDLKEKRVEHHYSSKHHSGIMVPVYAYGPGAELFGGTYENTDVFSKMKQLYGF